jgi:hypothetical protein
LIAPDAGKSPAPDSVPVSVDAVRQIGDIRMARVTYFVVSSESPLPTWDLRGLGGPGASLQALGLVGVICAPTPPGTRFESPEQIDALYNLLEETRGLSVEIEDLWLPTQWFPEERDPHPLAVYRVGLSLFQHAYRFRQDEISERELQEGAEWKGVISYSPKETLALQGWAKTQLERAREVYPKDEGLALEYTDDDAPWRNPRAWEAGGDASS